MIDVVEVWADTGKIVEREFTAEEQAQRAEDERAHKAAEKQQKKDAETRSSAIAHAKTLGFTDDMIAVMYPGLASEK
jgi:hypothetical protein